MSDISELHNELMQNPEYRAEYEASTKIETGYEMWEDLIANHGLLEAIIIGKRYLDMQIFVDDESEYKFCCELYAAMKKDGVV